MQPAKVTPCDSVLRFIYQDRVSKFDQQVQLYRKLNRRNMASLSAMNGANKYMGNLGDAKIFL